MKQDNQIVALIIFLIFISLACREPEGQSTQNENISFACMPNTLRCVGELRQLCDLQGQWEEAIACPDQQKCTLSELTGEEGCQAIPSPECTYGENRCVDALLQHCNQGGKWDEAKPCATGEQCQNSTDTTSSAACVEIPIPDQALIDMQVDISIQEDLMIYDLGLDQMVDATVPCESCMIEWIKLDAGRFSMGSDQSIGEQPIHEVLITKAFMISKTEVTVAQYRACVESGACTAPQPYQEGQNLKCVWNMENDSQYPVNCLTWLQAKAFANWIGGDLPSEAQWEYAAKSMGQVQLYPWGNDLPTCLLANYTGDNGPCYATPTAPVGQALSVCQLSAGNTAQGLCDMAGNLFEWTLDQYHPFYDNAPSTELAWCDQADCLAPNIEHVVRGGSWLTGVDLLRASARYHYQDSFAYDNIGFRVVKALNP